MEINITLISVVVVICLFIPGFFFRRFYYSGQFTKQFASGTFAERFIISVFWGIGIQAITMNATGTIFNLKYDNFKEPISKFYSQLCDNKWPDISGSNLKHGAVYMFCTLLVAMILGFAAHKVIRFFRLDIRIPALRYANRWNYYFKGDLERHRTKHGRRAKVISTEMDIVTDDGNGNSKLFSGFLYDYSLSQQTGDLETIVITNAQRYVNTTHAFVSIPGDCLIIPYNKVINFNIRYNLRVSRLANLNNILNNCNKLATILSFTAIFYIIPKFFYNDIKLIRTILAILFSGVLIVFVSSLLDFLINVATSPRARRTRATIGQTIFGFILIITFLTIAVAVSLKIDLGFTEYMATVVNKLKHH